VSRLPGELKELPYSDFLKVDCHVFHNYAKTRRESRIIQEFE
jgi:hypothetical protein